MFAEIYIVYSMNLVTRKTPTGVVLREPSAADYFRKVVKTFLFHQER